jgi:hypothetical protein
MAAAGSPNIKVIRPFDDDGGGRQLRPPYYGKDNRSRRR